jgi:hypothetical protein
MHAATGAEAQTERAPYKGGAYDMERFRADRAIGFLVTAFRADAIHDPSCRSLVYLTCLPKPDISRTLAFAKANDLPSLVTQS